MESQPAAKCINPTPTTTGARLSSSTVQKKKKKDVVPVENMEKLLLEMDRMMMHVAPQALAVPAEWRKEVIIPPCEIIFDASIQLLDSDIDDESLADDNSCDSVAGSSRCGGSSVSSACCQVQNKEAPPAETISDAELARQIRAIQVNPFPARVQGICQHWHALLSTPSSESDSESDFALRLMEHGGMEAILDAMILQKDFSQVQQAACWVLGALVCQEAMFKEWFVECSGLQSILAPMQSFQEKPCVQEAACAALQCLTYNHEPSKLSVADEGGAEAILQAMRSHKNVPVVQEQGCAALANLASSNNADILQRIVRDGGTTVIAKAMEVHLDNPRIQEYGCSALSNLASSVDPESHHIDGIRAILAAMRNHEANMSLQQLACTAIHSLSSHKRIKDFLASNNAIDLVYRAMNNYPLDPSLQQAAAKALAVIFRDPSLTDKSQAIHAIAATIINHTSNVEVLDCCLRALGSLTEGLQGLLASPLEDNSSRVARVHGIEDQSLGYLTFWIHKIMSEHMPLLEPGAKVLQNLSPSNVRNNKESNRRKSWKSGSNVFFSPCETPKVITRKGSDLLRALESPTEVTSVYVDL